MPIDVIQTQHIEKEPVIERTPLYMSRYEIDAESPVLISTDHYMATTNEMQESIGISAPLVCGIFAAGKEFAVLDTRNTPKVNTPLLLIDGEYSRIKGTELGAFKGLRDNESVEIGRIKHTDRFKYPDTVSACHFSLRFDEKNEQLRVSDMDSTNGTFITGYIASEIQKQELVRSDFTRNFGRYAMEELESRYGDGDIDAPYGYYRNHPIIGRNSQSVRNGVYGTTSSEMVLVDDKSRAMRRVTDGFLDRLTGDDRNSLTTTIGVSSVLRVAERYVANVMRYDLDAVDRISRPHYDDNGLIDLSEYIHNGVGVCRHQALLAAHFIEESIDRRIIAGSVGVERNHDLEVQGAHAWAVYRPPVGDAIIVDPAQHFVGTRKEAEKQRRWKYSLANVVN
ncbi:FHA domain-containing protein [Candidatus Saccharibacteria bacterium]|nr:FHA domain-containing protein [Candidatus Saccharibacteria bacterium]MBH1973013.1 FHA domain-containing protein [Candidatus Saccharibacteria bacterium]MBH1991216.1 FHA domain-containing protein [Candidatus Saccharibacteria bacterium]